MAKKGKKTSKILVDSGRVEAARMEAGHHKSAFLANISHELRVPINGILGITELVSSGFLTQEQSEYMRLLHFSAESLLDIVNDLLDLSKIEAGHVELNPGPVSLREDLSQALKPLALRAEGRGLRLDVGFDESVPEGVLVDLTRLSQVLVNLVGHAIKFTQAGFVEVKVNGEPLEGGMHRLLFEVGDSGVGIPEDKLEAVFSPFLQLVNPHSREVRGTGLGLFIVAKLVSLMDGSVRCESSPGQGSRFFFTCVVRTDSAARVATASPAIPVLVYSHLPQRGQDVALLGSAFGVAVEPLSAYSQVVERCSQVNEPTLLLFDVTAEGAMQQLRELDRSSWLKVAVMARPGWEPQDGWDPWGLVGQARSPLAPSELFEFMNKAANLPADGQASPDGMSAEVRPLRLLVVEDNRVNQRIIQAKLERLGHRVVVSDNGLEALNTLLSQSFDMVLVDIQMPLMDGYEFTRAVRAWEADGKAPLPIIALAARAMTGDVERCLGAGMSGYLQKPIISSDLLRTLEEFGRRTVSA